MDVFSPEHTWQTLYLKKKVIFTPVPLISVIGKDSARNQAMQVKMIIEQLVLGM